MTSYFPTALRRLVAARADHLCEYCLIHEDDSFFGCQVDHVIAEKHGGATVAGKGSDIAALALPENQLVPLFNPRTARWTDHFALNGVRIEASTDVGRATITLLRMNAPERLLEREALAVAGRYPSPAASARTKI